MMTQLGRHFETLLV